MARLFCFSSKTDRLFEITRSKFPGYFRLSPSEYKKLWKQGIISMDANVLLDLYRYSQETRDELLKLLNNLKDRLWITNRAAFEFLEGRAGAICENITRYEDSIARLDDLEKSFKEARSHPFLEEQTAKEFSDTVAKLRQYLSGQKAEWEARAERTDEVEDTIVMLLEGRVGDGFSTDRISEICKEGQLRFEKKIPPGYADAKKPEGIARYGDLIIWLELMGQAKAEQKPVIFVTADSKEDWWRIVRGRFIGARPELRAEMLKESGQHVVFMSVNNLWPPRRNTWLKLLRQLP